MYIEIPWISFPDRTTRESLDRIELSLTVLLNLYESLQIQVDEIKRKEEKLMASVEELQTTLDGIAADAAIIVQTEAEQLATIAALKEQIASGTPVSQEQLDAMAVKAQGIKEKLDAIAAPAPPA